MYIVYQAAVCIVLTTYPARQHPPLGFNTLSSMVIERTSSDPLMAFDVRGPTQRETTLPSHVSFLGVF